MSPTDRDIRKRGALVAAAISMVWLIGGCAAWLALRLLRSDFEPVPALIAVGGAAAVLPSALLGWRYAPLALATRLAFLPMTILVVLLSDLAVVVAGMGSAAVVGVMTNVGPAISLDSLFWGLIQALLGGAVIYVIGLVIFGAPGLALAIPSAWYWEHLMRRTSSSPVRAGGGRGSADRLR